MISALAPYAKALVLLAAIVLAAAAQAVGLDLSLEPGHYAGLLVADLLVWATPNREPTDE